MKDTINIKYIVLHLYRLIKNSRHMRDSFKLDSVYGCNVVYIESLLGQNLISIAKPRFRPYIITGLMGSEDYKMMVMLYEMLNELKTHSKKILKIMNKVALV